MPTSAQDDCPADGRTLLDRVVVVVHDDDLRATVARGLAARDADCEGEPDDDCEDDPGGGFAVHAEGASSLGMVAGSAGWSVAAAQCPSPLRCACHSTALSRAVPQLAHRTLVASIGRESFTGTLSFVSLTCAQNFRRRLL